MQPRTVEVEVDKTPLLSMDGIEEFTNPLGSFYREFREDARPLVEWGERVKNYIGGLRRNFATRLRHIAVSSKYKDRQFHDEQGWPEGEPHHLDNLCADPTYRRVTIDDPRLVDVIEKTENDATTSEAFMNVMRREDSFVLIGVTTTSCITRTLGSLFPLMENGAVSVQKIIMARDGVASRKSRKNDEARILDEVSKNARLVLVPRLSDIQWK